MHWTLVNKAALLVAALFLGSCATSDHNVTISLSPGWIAYHFSEGGPASPYVDRPTKNWLIAAGIYIQEERAAFPSHDELLRFIRQKYPELKDMALAVPKEITPGVFSIRLAGGGDALLRVTSTRIELTSSDRRLVQTIVFNGNSADTPQNISPENQTVIHALIGAIS